MFASVLGGPRNLLTRAAWYLIFLIICGESQLSPTPYRLFFCTIYAGGGGIALLAFFVDFSIFI
jgi:hypothetical protein